MIKFTGDLMLEQLKEQVCQANKDLVHKNLVVETWGNVSAYDADRNLVVIKPSGVSYENLTPDDMVVVDMDCNVIEGNLNPSSDTKTHIEIYRHFKGVNAIVHTHSKWATIYAQMRRPIPILGTTHADYFKTDIPVAPLLGPNQINEDYEKNTGLSIVEAFSDGTYHPLTTPAVLLNQHGPFCWSTSIDKVISTAIVLEFIAEMAYFTTLQSPYTHMDENLLNKHFNRKHGKHAYYGQKKGDKS